jgi:lipopolysaccharide/colanic/teichoic acid biosynthesis glycosyltransferase
MYVIGRKSNIFASQYGNIMENVMIERLGKELFTFIQANADTEAKSTLMVSTATPFAILNNPDKFNTIINLQKINDIRFINKFFEAVNSRLENGDTFIGCLETFSARKEKKKINRVPVIRTFYFGFEFIFMRAFPKLAGLKKVYFVVTKGKNRLLSKAEALGRLVSCGFRIEEYKTINGLLYFVVKKEKEPDYNMTPSYGPLYKMPRIGKNAKIIKVYKFRTMHPYAEYLQDYILSISGYSKTGKPADDFRLTPWGKYFRKYWIDEFPQLINLLKGDLKLIGVRPISQRYFNDIPADLQELRLKQKPGCIPPYISLNKKSDVQSVLEAERQYLKEIEKHPYVTDIKYFFKALYSIGIKGKRSA